MSNIYTIIAERWVTHNEIKKEILKIRAEIEAIEINGQVDEHTMFIRSAEQVKNMALNVIDKHINGEHE